MTKIKALITLIALSNVAFAQGEGAKIAAEVGAQSYLIAAEVATVATLIGTLVWLLRAFQISQERVMTKYETNSMAERKLFSESLERIEKMARDGTEKLAVNIAQMSERLARVEQSVNFSDPRNRRAGDGKDTT